MIVRITVIISVLVVTVAGCNSSSDENATLTHSNVIGRWDTDLTIFDKNHAASLKEKYPDRSDDWISNRAKEGKHDFRDMTIVFTPDGQYEDIRRWTNVHGKSWHHSFRAQWKIKDGEILLSSPYSTNGRRFVINDSALSAVNPSCYVWQHSVYYRITKNTHNKELKATDKSAP